MRDRLRRLDVDSITFASGAWEITPEQYPALEAVAHAMMRVISGNPNAVFLIEGHTDAVGDGSDNLSLSDRRAEAVAEILTASFQIPPENLVTQGYGEQYLKIPTDGPSRENRRVSVRRITPLLQGAGERGRRLLKIALCARGSRANSARSRCAPRKRGGRHLPPLPQLLAGDRGAFAQRLELRPHDARVHLLRAGEGGEAAVGACDHVLPPDHAGVPADPLGHQLGMLDQDGRVA